MTRPRLTAKFLAPSVGIGLLLAICLLSGCAGVVAIIGHITSQQTSAVPGQINQAKVVLLSPAISSTELNQQADYFFRIIASNDITGQTLNRPYLAGLIWQCKTAHLYYQNQQRQV